MNATAPTADDASTEVELCPHCLKPLALCVCEFVTPIDNRIDVLVLQHPQEQDKLLGTARLTLRHLKKSTFAIGLSWPSLQKALGRPVDPHRWAILFLGPADAKIPAGQEVTVFEGNGRPVEDQRRALKALDGIVILDGSWSQAKTLWWRNPWVLKTKRIVIAPKTPSLYGKLRKEPRKEGLSTLEAVAFLLSRLEGKPDIERAMLSSFRRMLQRYRDSLKPVPETVTEPDPGSKPA